MKWLLLPGMDGSGAFFEAFLRVLPKEVEAVTVGFPPQEKLGYDELFQWLLPRLPKGEPFLVVAESFSGPLAVRLAAAQPGGMAGAAISASFVRNPLPRVLRRLPLDRIFRRHPPRALVRFVLADASTSPEVYEAFDKAIRYSPPEVLAHRARAALQVDETEALKTCRLPLLFLRARSDRLVRRRSTDLVRCVRPDARIVAIDAPHFLLQTKPEECFREIREFFGGCSCI